MRGSSQTVVSSLWLVYLTLTLTLTPSQVTSQRSSYNEVCNKTLKCDRRALLACTPEGLCDCSRPHEMLYEPLKGKCVSKAGEACKFIRGERDGDEFPTFELTPCVTNSECSPDGVCSCNSRYFEDVNGTCTLAQSHQQHCNAELKCSRYESLHCAEGGTCECDPRTTIYSPKKLQCVGLAWESCINGYCSDNASCSDVGGTKICLCDSGYFQNSVKLCQRKFPLNATCSYSSECQVFEGVQLACEGGICKCDSRSTIYSPQKLQCVGLAGEYCINGYCSDDASCSDAYGTTMCRCDSDYFRNSAKLCERKLPLNATCTSSSQCQVFKGVQLACENGICNCDSKFSRFGTAQRHWRGSNDNDNSDYSDYMNSEQGGFIKFEGDHVTQCLGLANSDCLDRLCVPGAYCSYYYRDKENGVCDCQPGFTRSKKGNCGPGLNQPCSGGDGCIDGLVCKQGVCACRYENQLFSEVYKTCRSIVGGPCGDSEECGEDAECSFDGIGDTTGHCRCRSGFVENQFGGCEIMYGGYCHHLLKEIKCDSLAELVCINSSCACPEFSEYNHDLRRCVGLVGATCDLIGQQDGCVGNADCQPIHPRLLLGGRCSCKEGFNETDFYTCHEVQKEVQLLVDVEKGQMVEEVKETADKDKGERSEE